MSDTELCKRNFNLKELPMKQLKQPKDASSIPLKIYADNLDFGFGNTPQVFVYEDEENILLRAPEYVDDKSPLIGEWVYKNCENAFKNKYLVMSISEKEMPNWDGNTMPTMQNLNHVSRRLFVEDKIPQPAFFRQFRLVVSFDGHLKEFGRSSIIPYDDDLMKAYVQKLQGIH